MLWRPRGSPRLFALASAGLCVALLAGITVVVDRGAASVLTLTSAEKALVGSVDANLAAKLTYDPTQDAYVFNATGKKKPRGGIKDDSYQNNVGPGDKKSVNLHSIDLPLNPAKGFTYYDDEFGLSFKVVPNFVMGNAQQVGNQIVYPLPDGGKAVYSLTAKGLKEDIVLDSAVDTQTFTYTLRLPDTLAARNNDRGGIGIYSATPQLYDKAKYANAADTSLVTSARRTAPKTYQVFSLPPPLIKQTHSYIPRGTGNVRYFLRGNTLQVIAEGLRNMQYPISVDPSVVINTTSGFLSGNTEGNIDYGTNQINRGGLAGGTAAWTTSTNSLPVPLWEMGSAILNGYFYTIMGCTIPCGNTNAIYYAPLSPTDGSVGAWTTNAVNFPSTNAENAAVAYNGYLYSFGGGGGKNCKYIKPNNDGSLGSWSSCTGLSQGCNIPTVAGYNNWIYLAGCTTANAVVSRVQVNADGSLGTWVSDSSQLPNPESETAGFAYNGYYYVTGGYNAGNSANIYYSAINSDGSLAGFQTNAISLPAATARHVILPYDGRAYLYDYSTTGVASAPINADGSIGEWSDEIQMGSGGHGSPGFGIYNGYMYSVGGGGSSTSSDVLYTHFTAEGNTSRWNGVTATPAGRWHAGTASWNDYGYMVEGCTSSGCSTSNNIYYTHLNADGSVNAWTSIIGALPGGNVSNSEATAYAGYLYAWDDLGQQFWYSAINDTDGSLGSFVTNGTSLPTSQAYHSVSAYNGYMYSFGGQTTTTAAVYYAPINSDGSVGTWATSAHNLPSASPNGRVVSYGGNVYYLGGGSGTSTMWYAPYTSSGDIGAWTTSAQSMPTTTSYFEPAVANGYIYILGGNTSNTSAYVAPITSTGDVGAWSQTASLAIASAGGAVFLNSYGWLYYASGCSGGTCPGSVTTAVKSVLLHDGGSGGAIEAPSLGTSQPTGTDQNTAAAYNGYLYSFGGMCNSGCPTSSTWYAPINSDGSQGSWTTQAANLPAATMAASMAQNKGYFYEIGGCTNSSCSVIRTTTYYATPNADGSMPSWQTGSALPKPLYDAAAASYNGYIYELGGCAVQVCGAPSSNVYVAHVNSDGTMGTWATTTSLPVGTSNLSAVAYNGYLYALGGIVAGSSVATVYYAQLNNSNGTVGTWATAEALPFPTDSGTAVALDGYIWSISGEQNNTSTLNYSFGAPINAWGSVGNWVRTNDQKGVYDLASVVYNGKVYQLGGYQAGYKGYVDYATLDASNRYSQYSQMVDLGVSNATLTTISYTGSVPGGLSSFSFATAATSTISSEATADTLTGTNGATGIEFVYVFVTLDDSNTASFPDSSSGAVDSYITSITVNYSLPCSHPSPTVRLRGGASFSGSALQPLDTCYP